MNYRSNRNTILIIASQEKLSEISRFCAKELANEGTKFLTASTGLDGIFLYHWHLPCITIIEDNLPDIKGSSVCSVIRDSVFGKGAANIFFVGESSSYLFNTYADFFFQKPLQYDLLGIVLKEFFYQRKINSPEFVAQIGNAVRKQRSLLPQKLDTPHCFVNCVFSAYSELSGDGLDYWVSETGSDLYGFIFDNTGHDLLAYSQTSAIRTMLKVSFNLYQSGMVPSLGKILFNINNDVFTASDDDPSTVAMFLFHISFENNMLYYAPAGMPRFYTDYGEGFNPVNMRNPVIGGFKGVDYDDFSLPLDEIERLFFLSDGLDELLTLESSAKPPYDDLAKHDDVSGIIVEIKRE